MEVDPWHRQELIGRNTASACGIEQQLLLASSDISLHRERSQRLERDERNGLHVVRVVAVENDSRRLGDHYMDLSYV